MSAHLWCRMRNIGGLLGVILLAAACSSHSSRPASLATATQSLAVPASATANATLTLTPAPTAMATLPVPSLTPTLPDTPTATTTAPPPPLEYFSSPLLRPGVLPATYLDDTCEYLRLRWEAGKAEPGSVVVPVMFHSIVQPPSKVTDPKDITVEQFQAFVGYAASLGFETITTQELLDFLLYNDHIPPRSMILIVDDRRPGLIYEHFLPVLEQHDWTVTAAYIADPDSMEWAWDWMERLKQTGRLDVQSHGYTGQLYVLPETPIEQIQLEIWESSPVIENHFGTRPIAFIWPGGNFTPQSVQVARQGGYQLGFTVYSRGPLLFNWIPLGEEERLVNDPLMLLPRAWSNSVNFNLDEAVRVSQQAADFAKYNYAAEAAWLDQYCQGN